MLAYIQSPELLSLRLKEPDATPCQPHHPPKLLDQARTVLRRQHYSIRTEEAYLQWIIRFILFHHKRHPRTMAGPEIEAFLTHLAVDRRVAASTQNQAFSALLFLYKHVLDKPLSAKVDALRAKSAQHLPTVLTRSETRRLIAALSGAQQWMAKLLYGSGLRLIECVRLRVKNLDFEPHLFEAPFLLNRGGLDWPPVRPAGRGRSTTT